MTQALSNMNFHHICLSFLFKRKHHALLLLFSFFFFSSLPHPLAFLVDRAWWASLIGERGNRVTQHEEEKLEHKSYMGHPHEGKGVESRSQGVGVRVSTRRGSLWHGKSEPIQGPRLPCQGKGGGRNGRPAMCQGIDQINKIIRITGAKFLWKGRKLA